MQILIQFVKVASKIAKSSELQTKTKQVTLPVYGDTNSNTLILTIKGMIQVLEDVESILIIIAGTFFGSPLGAYGVYKRGTLTMEIECLKG